MRNLFSFIEGTWLKANSPFIRSKFGAHKCSKTQKRKGPPWRILFFGTDHFSLASLKPLCAKLRTGTLIESLGVVAKKHSVVYKFSEDEKLPLHPWPLDGSQIQSSYDIGMVVSFGNLIPPEVINSLPLGCINVHASLLPRWRGAAPILHAILAGDNETGVTIMRIHPFKFDVGEIVRQYRTSINGNETAEELERRLSVLGADLLLECLRDLPKCVEKAIPQPQIGITYAPKVNPNFSHVNWEALSAQSVVNLHRSISHLYPLKTSWHGQIVKLHNVTLAPQLATSSSTETLKNTDLQKSALNFLLNDSSKKVDTTKVSLQILSGTCSYVKARKSLSVVCADGREVLVDSLQVANKRMTAVDFYNGYLTKKTTLEWRFRSLSQSPNQSKITIESR